MRASRAYCLGGLALRDACSRRECPRAAAGWDPISAYQRRALPLEGPAQPPVFHSLIKPIFITQTPPNGFHPLRLRAFSAPIPLSANAISSNGNSIFDWGSPIVRAGSSPPLPCIRGRSGIVHRYRRGSPRNRLDLSCGAGYTESQNQSLKGDYNDHLYQK